MYLEFLFGNAVELLYRAPLNMPSVVQTVFYHEILSYGKRSQRTRETNRTGVPVFMISFGPRVASISTEALSREVIKGSGSSDPHVFKLGTRRWWSASRCNRFTAGTKWEPAGWAEGPVWNSVGYTWTTVKFTILLEHKPQHKVQSILRTAT